MKSSRETDGVPIDPAKFNGQVSTNWERDLINEGRILEPKRQSLEAVPVGQFVRQDLILDAKHWMSSKTIEWQMLPLRLKTLEIAPSLIAICAEPPIV